jgi:hypothetical protein
LKFPKNKLQLQITGNIIFENQQRLGRFLNTPSIGIGIGGGIGGFLSSSSSSSCVVASRVLVIAVELERRVEVEGKRRKDGRKDSR